MDDENITGTCRSSERYQRRDYAAAARTILQVMVVMVGAY